MLSKDKRLNLKKDYHFLVSGHRLESKFLKLFVKFSDGEMSKVGITSPAAIFKKASQRNRARRIVSAAFEPLYDKLLPRLNILALPKAGVLSVKSGLVLIDLEDVLKINKLLKDEKTTGNNN